MQIALPLRRKLSLPISICMGNDHCSTASSNVIHLLLRSQKLIMRRQLTSNVKRLAIETIWKLTSTDFNPNFYVKHLIRGRNARLSASFHAKATLILFIALKSAIKRLILTFPSSLNQLKNSMSIEKARKNSYDSYMLNLNKLKSNYNHIYWSL